MGLTAVLLAVLAPVAVIQPAPAAPSRGPVVRGVSPASGSVSGGTVVTIKGRHLDAGKVRFGTARPARVLRAGARRITVVTPPHAAGEIPVRVKVHGTWSRPRSFTFVGQVVAPHLTALVPAAGQVGDTVAVVGDGFTAASNVYVDGVKAQVLASTPTRLTVVAPSHAPGPAAVSVVTPDATTGSLVFTYRAPPGCTVPQVGWIEPPGEGPREGGTRVTVHGGGFTDVLSVTFAGVPGTAVDVVSPTELGVTSPPHALGLTYIQVQTICDLSAPGSAYTQFHYVPSPPTVASVSPSELSMAGGRVTITGTNFEEVSRVDFGDDDGTDLVVLSPTTLQVTAPPVPAYVGTSTTSVGVVTSGGYSPSNPGTAFTWRAPPSVLGTSPTFSAVSGGSRILVTGQDFTGLGGVTSVDFGGTPGTDVVVDSDARLHVTTPPHAQGIVQVHVTSPAGTSKVSEWTDFAFDGPTPTVGSSAVGAPLPGGSPARSDINDVDCPAPGECFAVGSFDVPGDESRFLVEHLSGGVWTPTELPLPDDAVHGPDWYQDARMQHVVCPAVDFCAAVGVYDTEGAAGSPFFATWDGATWTTSHYDVGEAENGDDWIHWGGIDCTADRTCVAVGADQVFTDVDGSWVPAPEESPPVPRDRLVDVDCTDTDCTAVGYAVSPTSDRTPLIEHGVGTTWTATLPGVPADGGGHGALSAVSCAAAGSCVAVGRYVMAADGADGPLVESLSDGVWSPSAAPRPSESQPLSSARLKHVACASTTSCVAVGTYASVLPMVTHLGPGTAESRSVSVAGMPRTEASLGGVVCRTSGSCLALGTATVDGVGDSAVVVDLAGAGALAAVRVLTPFPAGESAAAALAVESVDQAVAVGQYVDADGHAHGMLVTGVPFTP